MAKKTESSAVEAFPTTAGGGAAARKARQSVAQSTAIAVQDAADHLRNTATITSTAIGVALAEWMATRESQPYVEVIDAATKALSAASENFANVAGTAATAINSYPADD